MINLGSKDSAGTLLASDGATPSSNEDLPVLHISSEAATEIMKLVGEVGDSHTIEAKIRVAGKSDRSWGKSVELEFVSMDITDPKTEDGPEARMYPSMKE